MPEDEIELEQLPQLKQVEYEGLNGFNGRVAYQRRGNRIVFTGLIGSDKATSTVNASNQIVQAIAEAEGIDWRNPRFGEQYDFYDLSTPVGYPNRLDPLEKLRRQDFGVGDIELDRLKVTSHGDRLITDSWTPVDIRTEGKPIVDSFGVVADAAKNIYEPNPEYEVEVSAGLTDFLDHKIQQVEQKLRDKSTPYEPKESAMLLYLIDITSEYCFEMDEDFAESLRKIRSAYAALVLPRLRATEQGTLWDEARESRSRYWLTNVQLNDEEAVALQTILKAVDVVVDPQQRDFSWPKSSESTVSYLPDEPRSPAIDQVLAATPPEPEQSAEHLLKNINHLSYKDQVQLLLKLTDAQFAAFKKRYSDERGKAAEQLHDYPGMVPDREERIRVISGLNNLAPRFIVVSEIRRIELSKHGDYPSAWDAEFAPVDDRFSPNDGLPRVNYLGQQLTYEAAIIQAKLEHAREFYMAVDMKQIPNLTALEIALANFAAGLKPGPGTEVIVDDLAKVIKLYREHPAFDGKRNRDEEIQLEDLTKRFSAGN